MVPVAVPPRAVVELPGVSVGARRQVAGEGAPVVRQDDLALAPHLRHQVQVDRAQREALVEQPRDALPVARLARVLLQQRGPRPGLYVISVMSSDVNL